MTYLYLLAAILLEVMATSMMKASDGFSKLTPSLLAVIGYCGAFYCLSLTMRSIPMGISYAIWSGLGIVLITAIGWIWFKQELDAPAIIGLTLILAGVLVINIFSKTLS